VKVDDALDCSDEFIGEGLDPIEVTDQGANAGPIVRQVVCANERVVAGLDAVPIEGVVRVQDVIENVVEVDDGAAVEIAGAGEFAA